ncbi:hypothetical protein ZWY2020_057830 [Hordeum vulgare]|nr:hypothetical protein ZWY2020_057830 [Hordeum vulgare]
MPSLARSSFGYRGVCPHPSNVYYAKICSSPTRIGLGTFETSQTAARTYDVGGMTAREATGSNELPGRFDGDMDVVLKTLSVNSPRGGGPVPAWAPMRHAEKPTQHVGGPRAGGGAGRAIRQPR